jgi:hypothetical protein
MRRFAAIPFTLVVLGACGGGSWSDSPVTDVAQAWSGSSQLPLCRSTGPDGEQLGSADARYCEWKLAAGDRSDRLTGIVRPRSSVVTWIRALRDTSDAGVLWDSIGTALAARGLRMRACAPRTSLSGETRAVRWDGDSLAVVVVRLATRRGPARVQVTAADDPRVMPGALCPLPPVEG